MAFRLRPSIVAAAFVILLAVIANLAWVTAVSTTGPWFSATVSLDMYAVTLIVASLLALGIVLFAATRATALDASQHGLDRRIALLRGSAVRPGMPPGRPVPLPPELRADIDAEPDDLVAGDEVAVVGLEKKGHDALVELPSMVASASAAAKTDVLRDLVRERVALREARAHVWTTALGPAAMAILFLAVAGPMLPGAEGFAAAHYQLNTTLILFLAYGFAPLVAWSVIGVGMLATLGRRSAP